MWTKTAANKYCKNSDLREVVDQASCQALCEADKYCPGISYSYTLPMFGNVLCYVCKDETLSSATDNAYILNDYGFYTRPGKLRNTYISTLVALSLRLAKYVKC